jgi:hypothetical protein
MYAIIRTVVFHVAPAGGGPPVKAPPVPPWSSSSWARIGTAISATEAKTRTSAIVVAFAAFLDKCIFYFSHSLSKLGNSLAKLDLYLC